MPKRINFPTKEYQIEEAILMLVDFIRENCRNPKPLILHSLRVGMKLLELDQPREVVIAGILHDLIEDTDCKLDLIKKKFGPRVTKLVWACTHEDIVDYRERWQVLMAKIKKAGKGAMMIKLLDATDNLPYVLLIKDKEKLGHTFWKHRLVIKDLKSKLGRLEVYKEYVGKYKKIVKMQIYK